MHEGTQTMQILRLTLLAIAVLALSPVTAAAQFAPNEFATVEDVARRCPGLIRRDHDFTDAVATVLHQRDFRWGRNGKRGNPNDPSHDAIAYKTVQSPFGVAVIDIIGGAGGPSPSPAWIDQTQATIDARTTGVWVAPSGRLPACLTGGSTPTPPSPVPTPPPPTVESDLVPILREVVAALARMDTRLTAIEARPVPDFLDVAVLNAYVDAMVGKGPSGDPQVMPNHVTDIKERLDRIRVLLEQLNAWLRSRSTLRF